MTTARDRETGDVTLRESVPPGREWARAYLIGIFMGTADAVPGVSGGTIALIAGIYTRLIGAITAVTPARLVAGVRALTPLDGGVSIQRALHIWEEVDGWFLVALVGGIGTAVVVVTRIVDVLREAAPVLLFGFFFGLIGASALILVREISITRLDSAAAAVVGFLVAFVVSGMGEVLSGSGLPVVFVAGAIAVSAMILPGISGSLLLVVLSQYTEMTEALSGFTDGILAQVTGTTAENFGQYSQEVGVFVLGAFLGLFTIARVVRRALTVNREATYAFLVALVVGALRAPIAELNGPEYDVGWTSEAVGAFTTVALAGAVLVLLLDWYALDIDLDRT